MRALLIAAALVLAGSVAATVGGVAIDSRVRATGGGSRGAELYHTSSPACVACHNERRGSLAYSRLDRNGIRYRIRNGSPGAMPAYRFHDRDLEALVDYVVALRPR